MTKSKGYENATGCPFTKKTGTGCPFSFKEKNTTPCPVLNSLIKMGHLDSKKEWSTQNVQDALKKIKISKLAAFLLVNSTSNTLKNQNLPFTAKSLQTHDLIEHDASMSRKDYNLGDHIHFSKKLFIRIKKYFPNQKDITLKDLTEYRYYLYQKSIKENANVNFGVKQYFTIGAETCAIFLLLSEDDKLSLKKLRQVFEKETLDNVTINSINMPNFVTSYIKFTSYWVNTSLQNTTI